LKLTLTKEELVLCEKGRSEVSDGWGRSELSNAKLTKDLLGDDLALRVELVDDGNTGRELDVDNLLARKALEGLDDGAERVAVSGDEDLLSLLDAGEDLSLVVGEGAVGGELERLSSGGRDVIGTAPDMDLLLSELLAGC
jgi:hypothetical protein